MKYILFILLLLLPFHVLNSQSVSKENQKYSADVVKSREDSLMIILDDQFEYYPQMSDSEKAAYGLIYTENMLYASIGSKNESLIDFSIDYFSKTNQKQKLAKSLIYKGRIFKKNRDYPNAILMFLKAKDLLDPQKDFSLLGSIYFDLGHLSSYQDEFDKSLEYLELAKINLKKSGNVDNLSKLHVLIAWVYQTIGDLDAAIESSLTTLELAQDSVTIGDALNDIGYSFYQKGQLDSAHYYISKSLFYPYYYKNGAIRYYHQAQVFADIQQYDSAKFYLDKALHSEIDIYTENDCYKLLIRMSMMSGDMENLPAYVAMQQFCGDSLRKIEMQPNINTLVELHESSKVIEQAKSQRAALVVFILIVISVSISLLILLYKQTRHEKAKASSYQTELQTKHEVLLEELRNDFEKARDKYSEKRKILDLDQRQQIEKSIYNEVLYLDDEQKFIKKMNALLNFLPDKLKADHPNITYKEIVWCCLFMLDIPTQDIAMLLDYTQSSLYKFKQRLSKKLNLSGSKELEILLQEKLGL